jgi:hypothetical protein
MKGNFLKKFGLLFFPKKQGISLENGIKKKSELPVKVIHLFVEIKLRRDS